VDLLAASAVYWLTRRVSSSSKVRRAAGQPWLSGSSEAWAMMVARCSGGNARRTAPPDEEAAQGEGLGRRGGADEGLQAATVFGGDRGRPVNDAERLCLDPAMRIVASGRAGSTSRQARWWGLDRVTSAALSF
jgi:hypothetical protein